MVPTKRRAASSSSIEVVADSTPTGVSVHSTPCTQCISRQKLCTKSTRPGATVCEPCRRAKSACSFALGTARSRKEVAKSDGKSLALDAAESVDVVLSSSSFSP